MFRQIRCTSSRHYPNSANLKFLISGLLYKLLTHSHNRLKTIEHISCLRTLRDLNISFNLVKNKEDFSEAVFKLGPLVKIDTRQNLFNSKYYAGNDKCESDQYRFSFIYNFSETISMIDGVTITNDERANTFLYYSQQPAIEYMKNTRLFKLTETLDTQLVKIHEIMDSARRELSRHELLRESSKDMDTRNTPENFATGIKAASVQCNGSRPMSISEAPKSVLEKNATSTAKKLDANLKEFDHALKELKGGAKSVLTEKDEGNSNSVLKQSKGWEKNEHYANSEFASVLSVKDKNTSFTSGHLPQKFKTLDQSGEAKKQGSGIAANYQSYIEGSYNSEKHKKGDSNLGKSTEVGIGETPQEGRKMVTKITGEFRKVFREELDSLKNDLRGKMDKYRESKNMSMRSIDCSMKQKGEENTDTTCMVQTIQQKCEENEKKLRRMRSKMNKLIRMVKKTKENEGVQKEFYDTSIAQLKQKMSVLETQNTSFSYSRKPPLKPSQENSRSFMLNDSSAVASEISRSNSQAAPRKRSVFNVNIQTELRDPEVQPADILKRIFEKHAMGNKAIPSGHLNKIARDIMDSLRDYPLSRPISDIIVELTKNANKNDCITLDNVLLSCGLKPVSTMNKRSPRIHRSESRKSVGEKRVIQKRGKSVCARYQTNRTEKHILHKLTKGLEEEMGGYGNREKIEEQIMKLFGTKGCHVAKISKIGPKMDERKFFFLKMKASTAKLLFYAGATRGMKRVAERRSGVKFGELVFSGSLVPGTKGNAEALLAVVYLGKERKVETKKSNTAQGIFG